MKKAIVVGGGISGLATAYLLRKRAAGAGVVGKVDANAWSVPLVTVES